MREKLQIAVARHRRRFAFLAFAQIWARLAVASLLIAACLALELRAVHGAGRDVVVGVVIVSLVAATIASLVLALRRVPDHDTVVAWLDARSGGTGFVLTSETHDDGAWGSVFDRALAKAPALVSIPWRRRAALLAGALAFAAVPFFVTPTVEIFPSITAAETSALEQLREKLDVLEENVELEAVGADDLRETLERLEREVESGSEESAFEAFDRVDDRLDAAAAEAAASASMALDDLATAGEFAPTDETLAREALERAAERLTAGGLDQALDAAAELARADELDAASDAAASEQASSASKEPFDASMLAKLSGEQLRTLAGEAAKRAGERLDRLADARMLRKFDDATRERLRELASACKNPGSGSKLGKNGRAVAMKKGDKKGDKDGEGFVEGEGECMNPDHAAECDGSHGDCMNAGVVRVNRPGGGGVDRGRGDAELTFGDESPGRSSEFESQTLPESQFVDEASSARVGVSAGAPTVDPNHESAGAGNVLRSQGEASWRRRIAPRHRAAVSAFFGPNAPAPKSPAPAAGEGK
jgi:hypothetical protein